MGGEQRSEGGGDRGGEIVICGLFMWRDIGARERCQGQATRRETKREEDEIGD